MKMTKPKEQKEGTGTLVEMPPKPEIPPIVQNGFTPVSFVRPHVERDDKDVPYVAFEISVPLVEGLSEWVPSRIRECWLALKEHDIKALTIPHAIICNAELAIVPTGDDRLELTAASVEKVVISQIEERGTGETRVVIRLQFRISVQIDDFTWRFARNHFGRSIWLRMYESQQKLKL
jgi:hypothetical protein